MKRICVFAGSKTGYKDEYEIAAAELGLALAKANIDLVYGGSKVGLMGIMADVLLRQGGRVIGVVPKDLFRQELIHDGLTQLLEVDNMHDRKAVMGHLADAFITLPGGLGTFEELFEVISWAQLGIHQKAIGLLNVEGYYTPILELIEHARVSGFLDAATQPQLISANTTSELMTQLLVFGTRRM